MMQMIDQETAAKLIVCQANKYRKIFIEDIEGLGQGTTAALVGAGIAIADLLGHMEIQEAYACFGSVIKQMGVHFAKTIDEVGFGKTKN